MSAVVNYLGAAFAPGGYAFTRLAAVVAVLLVGLGFAAERAHAGYSARVNNGTLTLTGNGASDQLALRLQAGVPTTLQVDVGDNGSADLSFDRAAFDRIVVNAGGGNDRVRMDEANGVFTDTEDDLDERPGRLRHAARRRGRRDVPRRRAERPRRRQRRGRHRPPRHRPRHVRLGSRRRQRRRRGQGGTDTLLFNGSGGGENFDFSANGNRLRFFRNLGNITMDTDKVERVDLEALGGADNAVVNDLTGTDVALANIDLEGVLGGGAGDGQPDTITAKGTAGGRLINVTSASGAIAVDGLAADVRIRRAEQGSDLLAIDGRGGGDLVKVFGSAAGDVIDIAPSPVARQRTGDRLEHPRLRGRDRRDDARRQGPRRPGHHLRCERPRGAARARARPAATTRTSLNGGDGADRLLGGAQNDLVDGNGGADFGLLGTGHDTFVWDPGDGSDVVEGQGGTDTLVFNGSGGGENFDFSANGQRFRFFRDLGNITMDTDKVERVDLEALGGADNAVVNDLDGTDVTLANIDLEGRPRKRRRRRAARQRHRQRLERPRRLPRPARRGHRRRGGPRPESADRALGGGQRPAHDQRPRRQRQVLRRRRPGCPDPAHRQRVSRRTTADRGLLREASVVL